MHYSRQNVSGNASAQGKPKSQVQQDRLWRQLLVVAISGSALIATPQLAHATLTETPPASGNFIASGSPNNGGDGTSVNDASVVTAPGYSVSRNTPGNAFYMNGSGALVYTDNNASSISNSDGNYAVIIESAGNTANPGSVVINTNGSITGGGGLVAGTRGTGNVTVVASGTITGNSAHGILARNLAGSGSISVTSGIVNGVTGGVIVNNNGISSTTVTANGAVTATGGPGIQVTAASTTTGAVNVTANAAVSGSTHGVNIVNNGSGSTTVTTEGTVNGTSGNGINVANAATAGALTVNANGVVTAGNVGILADKNGSGNLTVNAAANVTGGNHGVVARNYGSGDTSVTTDGTVTGTAAWGVWALNNTSAAGSLTVTTNGIVNGGGHAVLAQNNGTGATLLNINNNVTAGTGSAIIADVGTGAGNVTINVDGTIGAGQHGVYAANQGIGNTVITTTTDSVLTGIGLSGLRAINGATAGSVTINSNGLVTAGEDAIYVENDGTGATTIVAQQALVGTNQHGIQVRHNTAAGALNITTQSTVQGAQSGLSVIANGDGTATFTTNDAVNGTTGHGIYVYKQTGTGAIDVNANDTVQGNVHGIWVSNEATSTVTIDSQEAVTGGTHGIIADNAGGGNLTVTAVGQVTGTSGTGLWADVGDGPGLPSGPGNLQVTAVNATGGQYGVKTGSYVDGTTNVVVTGTARGTTQAGIDSVTYEEGNLDIHLTSTGVAEGGQYGIATGNRGSGATNITVDGLAHGGFAGVRADSYTGTAATLDIGDNAVVRNTTSATTDRAIRSVTGNLTVNNSGLILGTVYTVAIDPATDLADRVNNIDTWSVAGGTNDLGGGVNIIDNRSTGRILAANAVGGSVTTNFFGATEVYQSGAIILQNELVGGAAPVIGDRAVFVHNGSGDFQTNGGTIYLDTDVENHVSDIVETDDVTVGSGPTFIDVRHIGNGRPTTGDGIEVIDVNGVSANNAFVLAAPVRSGLWDYRLGQGFVDTQSWFLRTRMRDEAVAASSLSVLASHAAVNTLSNLHERQRGGEEYLPETTAKKGKWGRLFALNSEFSSDGDQRVGYDAKLRGAEVGLDLYSKLEEDGDRRYGGLYLSYASSNAQALRGSDRVGRLEVDALTLGAYYTKIAPSGWYMDAVGQYTRLSNMRIRTAENTLRPDGSSYALSMELGRRFNRDGRTYAELQGQLIYQHTSMDDVTLRDGTEIGIDNVKGFTGRLGLRVSRKRENAGRLQPWFRANLWHRFESNAKVTSLGSSSLTPISGTTGELQLGVALSPKRESGWSVYAVGGYLFDVSGAEYSGWKGKVAVRKGW